MTVKTISPSEVFRLQQESGGIKIIDVRESNEFAEVRSPLAINVPLSTFDPDVFATNFNFKSPVFLICRSGKRSMTAAQMLLNIGFESVYNVDGGMIEWEASGLPVVKN